MTACLSTHRFTATILHILLFSFNNSLNKIRCDENCIRCTKKLFQKKNNFSALLVPISSSFLSKPSAIKRQTDGSNLETPPFSKGFPQLLNGTGLQTRICRPQTQSECCSGKHNGTQESFYQKLTVNNLRNIIINITTDSIITVLVIHLCTSRRP